MSGSAAWPRPFAVLLAVLAGAPPGTLPAQTRADPALLSVAAGYAAKVAASAIFVSGRSLDSVLAEELAPDRPIEALIRPLLKFEVDADARTVTCRIATASATAVATDGLGCTLLAPGVDAATLRARRGPPRRAPADPAQATDAAEPWPIGEGPAVPDIEGLDRAALARALDAAFAEADRARPVRTRAVVVVHRGQLIAERYADGYHAQMPLPGWSMTKTVVAALVGIRTEQGGLDLDGELAVPEWRATDDDERRAIRLPHLLSMTGGLAWNEDYDDPASDALRMLFASADHASVYAAQPRAAAPGDEYRYSSGSTNLICRLLRASFAGDEPHLAFPHAALFAPAGMHSAVVETDPSGTFVGSSYGFATARDWARFGLLLADDGVAAGRRVLPAGWVNRMRTPAPASDGRFGWQVWLDADPDGDGPRQRRWPELPADLMLLRGHEGQYCAVVPSRRFVLVRLGCTKQGGFDFRGLVHAALAACGGD